MRYDFPPGTPGIIKTAMEDMDARLSALEAKAAADGPMLDEMRTAYAEHLKLDDRGDPLSVQLEGEEGATQE